MTGSIGRKEHQLSALGVGFRLVVSLIATFAAVSPATAQWLSDSEAVRDIYYAAHDNSYIRWDGGVMFGEQPGFEPGYYRFGLFTNMLETEDNLLFIDAHSIANYDNGALSGEFGVGHRVHDQNTGAVIGANAYYSHRQYENGPSEHEFHAYGFGLEYLTSTWSLRSNIYLSASGRRSNGGSTLFQMPTYVGNNIRLGSRSENFDEAMQGIDVEVSQKLPDLGLWGAEIGVGLHHLQAGGGPRNHAWGPQVRMDAWISDNLMVTTSYAYDRVFNHSFNGGVTLLLGGPDVSAAGRHDSERSRLWAPVRRRHTVPVVNYTDDVPDLLAHDPATGERITITHVDDGAGAGGDGTAETPFLTLSAASLSGTNIVLVQPGAYSGDSIVMSDDQRLLAASAPHTVNTQELGTIDLPGTGLGGFTAISGSPGDAITIANNTEVRGFLVLNASGLGISGQDVTGYDIQGNTLLNGAGNGISIELQPGVGPTAGIIRNNTIGLHDSPGAAGILVSNPAGDVNTQIIGNRVEGNMTGIVVIADTLNGAIDGNIATNSTAGPGIAAFSNSHDGDVVNNVAGGNAGEGILISTNAVASDLNVANNAANGNGRDGISIDILGDGPGVDLNVQGNLAIGNGRHGINVESQGNQNLDGVVAGNSANGNGGFGVLVNTNTALGSGNVAVDVAGNQANGNGLAGMALSSAADVTGDVFGNTANGNGDFGVWVAADQDLTASIIANSTNGNGLSGLRAVAARDVLANVVDNQANANGGQGVSVTAGRDIIGATALNQASGNGGPGISHSAGRDIVGDVVGNVAISNAGAGISFAAADSMQSTLEGNLANDNAGEGIGLSMVDFLGEVLDNTALGNALSGIRISTAGDFTGDIAGNETSLNLADGFQLTITNDFTGHFLFNTADDNGVYGFNTLAGGAVNGSVSPNFAAGNGTADFSGNIALP